MGIDFLKTTLETACVRSARCELLSCPPVVVGNNEPYTLTETECAIRRIARVSIEYPWFQLNVSNVSKSDTYVVRCHKDETFNAKFIHED